MTSTHVSDRHKHDHQPPQTIRFLRSGRSAKNPKYDRWVLDESELAQELAEHRLALRLAGHPDLGQHVVSSVTDGSSTKG